MVGSGDRHLRVGSARGVAYGCAIGADAPMVRYPCIGCLWRDVLVLTHPLAPNIANRYKERVGRFVAAGESENLSIFAAASIVKR
jgi:hypothetical protein